MQLIWVSGPTARVLTVSITRRKVLLALAGLAVLLLVLGGLFQLIGLRVALDHVPTLAQQMGGVASRQEQQRTEAVYQDRLHQLQQQLGQTIARVQQMETARQAFFGRLGLAALAQPLSPEADPRHGRGGPFKPLAFWNAESPALADRIAEASGTLADVQQSLEQLDQAWSRQHARLQGLPLALPIQQDFVLTSAFGTRMDPITHQPSRHEGLDFVAPLGTPIVATAPGQVVHAGPSGAYGKLVEVAHAQGFVTRYAHLQAILVEPGQSLQTGERLGLLGHTGRSTGPHLHYEVLYQGQPMHPVQAVQRWSRF